MKFNFLSETTLRHYLNVALNEALNYERIKINPEIENSISLEMEYTKLLNAFEEHLKDIIKTNKNL